MWDGIGGGKMCESAIKKKRESLFDKCAGW